MRGLRYISAADTTGYAAAGKAYLRALAAAGVPVTWTPLRWAGAGYAPAAAASVAEADLRALAYRPVDYDTVLVHTVPEYFPPWIARERAAGRRVVGYTVWELEHLPRHWPALLNRLDAVLVPCQWNLQVFRSGGVSVPIRVVPHLSQFGGLEASADDRAALLQRLGGAQGLQGRFVFYTVGTWLRRKAPERVLQTFLESFTRDDPVCLVVKTCARDLTRWRRPLRSGFRRRHPPTAHSAHALAARYPAAAPWHLIGDESLPDGQMRALHALGDAFVSLACTEGWGMGAFDAALCDRPVVMTGYGGQTEFLPPDLAQLVDYRMVPAREPIWPAAYRLHDRWAEPDTRQAAQWMRALAADPVAARARGSALGRHVREAFSGRRVLATLLAALGRPA